MTMTQRLAIHAEIESANRRRLEEYLTARYYESLTVEEIQEMLEEKDARMEWDDQFGFLSDLLDSKLYLQQMAN